MKMELQALRDELHRAMDSNTITSEAVVKLSEKLDRMILEFYRQAAETY